MGICVSLNRPPCLSLLETNTKSKSNIQNVTSMSPSFLCELKICEGIPGPYWHVGFDIFSRGNQHPHTTSFLPLVPSLCLLFQLCIVQYSTVQHRTVDHRNHILNPASTQPHPKTPPPFSKTTQRETGFAPGVSHAMQFWHDRISNQRYKWLLKPESRRARIASPIPLSCFVVSLV